jgi:hypothetical protein
MEVEMKKYVLISPLVLLIILMLAQDCWAIPAFARKYGFNCNMCHTAYTKLNDFGQRYRDNGYQIPGQEGHEKNVLETAAPIAMRLTLGYSAYDNAEGNTNSFNLFGFDFFAAGVLHKNISFLLIYTPRVDEPGADYAGNDALQPGGLESVSLIFSNIIQDALNLRIGRFEPGYHVFSSKRSYYLFQPYEIYSFSSPRNDYNFDDNQIGIEASGHFRNGFKYAAGFINGNGAFADNNKNKDFYGNLIYTFGDGDGQSAGQRIGMFGYYGWQPTDLPGSVVAPTGETNGNQNESFYRYGFDGSFNWETFNLQLFYMNGIDDKAFNFFDQTQDYKYSGGFAELDYAALFNNRLVVSIMYNWIQPPSYDEGNYLNAYTALVRYYLGGWTAVNVGLHAEFAHRELGKTNKQKDNLIALALDFAF